ncbi:MAG: serine hydrolase [Synechococcus sp.]
MRNGRSRHSRQSGDRRRGSSSSDRARPLNSPRSPWPRDFESGDFERGDGSHPEDGSPQHSPPRSHDPRFSPDRPRLQTQPSPAQQAVRPQEFGSPNRHQRPNRAPRDQDSPERKLHSDRRSATDSSAQQRSPRRRKSRSSKSSSRKPQHSSWQAIAFQGFILSVGLGLVCGLIARRWGAALSTLPDASGTTPSVTSLAPSTFIAPSDPTTRPGAPIDELNQALEALDGEYPDLQLGTVLVDISERNYAGLRAQEAFPAASTIKLAVLAAVMESVDAGDITLTEKLPLQPTAVAGGSGALDSQPPGTEVSVLRAAELMISTSDNTATNVLVDRLGGIEVANQRFLQWGLQHTELVNPLPDLGGENTSSPADFALLLGEIERGEILTMRSRDRFLDILSSTRNDTLLPQSLEEGDRIAHKTGTINSSLGDVGLIDLPNGQRYIAAVMVRRENGDSDAETIIQEVSRLARNYWNQDVLPE